MGTTARGINDAGQITGSSVYWVNGEPSINAYVYDGTTWTNLGPGRGQTINEFGEVTGFTGAFEAVASGPTGSAQAFLYSGGVMKLLGTLSAGTVSQGLAINSAGQVVGSSYLGHSIATHAFFYDGVLIDMNALISPDDPLKSYVTLTEATGINDNRLLVVNGQDSRDSSEHAYLLQGPWVDFSAGSLSFANTTPGVSTAPQTLTISNSGMASVALGIPTISGDFSQTNTCGATLSAGGSCTVGVIFTPTANGNRTGALIVGRRCVVSNSVVGHRLSTGFRDPGRLANQGQCRPDDHAHLVSHKRDLLHGKWGSKRRRLGRR
jgi:probable HAF family extracellular repeat protein